MGIPKLDGKTATWYRNVSHISTSTSLHLLPVSVSISEEEQQWRQAIQIWVIVPGNLVWQEHKPVGYRKQQATQTEEQTEQDTQGTWTTKTYQWWVTHWHTANMAAEGKLHVLRHFKERILSFPKKGNLDKSDWHGLPSAGSNWDPLFWQKSLEW